MLQLLLQRYHGVDLLQIGGCFLLRGRWSRTLASLPQGQRRLQAPSLKRLSCGAALDGLHAGLLVYDGAAEIVGCILMYLIAPFCRW